MIEYGRFFTKLYRIRRGYYRRNITIRLSVGYEYRLKNKEIFKEVFVSLRGRNIATFKFTALCLRRIKEKDNNINEYPKR